MWTRMLHVWHGKSTTTSMTSEKNWKLAVQKQGKRAQRAYRAREASKSRTWVGCSPGLQGEQGSLPQKALASTAAWVSRPACEASCRQQLAQPREGQEDQSKAPAALALSVAAASQEKQSRDGRARSRSRKLEDQASAAASGRNPRRPPQSSPEPARKRGRGLQDLINVTWTDAVTEKSTGTKAVQNRF